MLIRPSKFSLKTILNPSNGGETLGAMAKSDANIDDDRKKCGKFNPDWTHFIILEVHKGQTFIYIAEHVEI